MMGRTIFLTIGGAPGTGKEVWSLRRPLGCQNPGDDARTPTGGMEGRRRLASKAGRDDQPFVFQEQFVTKASFKRNKIVKRCYFPT